MTSESPELPDGAACHPAPSGTGVPALTEGDARALQPPGGDGTPPGSQLSVPLCGAGTEPTSAAPLSPAPGTADRAPGGLPPGPRAHEATGDTPHPGVPVAAVPGCAEPGAKAVPPAPMPGGTARTPPAGESGPPAGGQGPAGAARLDAAAPAGTTGADARKKWRAALASKAKAARTARATAKRRDAYQPGMNRRQPS